MLDLSERHLNRTILHLAWPAILESLLQLTVSITDSIMIGPLGTQAFAAVGQGSILQHYLLFPIWGIGTASAAIVSRNIGRRDMAAAESGAGQGLFLAIITGVVFTVGGVLFGRDILLLLGTAPEVVEPGTRYLTIVLSFSIFYSIRTVGSSILRAVGDTKTPMISTGVMNVFNIGANWVLIYGVGPFPRMETAGAALATGLSFMIGAGIVLWKLLRNRNGFHMSFRGVLLLNSGVMKIILRIAAPNMAEMLLMRAGGLTYLWIITSLGTVPLAAHFMAVRVESLAFMPAFGLSVAVPPIVGQALGANRSDLAALAVKRTVRIGFRATSVLGLIFLLIPGVFVRIFSPQPDVYPLAILCVQISAFELAGVTLNMIYGGAMRGAGDTVSPMIVTFIGAIVIRIGVIYVLAITLGLGLPGVWLGTVIDWTLRATAGYVLFRRGRWMRVRV